MKAVVEREQPQPEPPIKSVTLTLTSEEATILREVGNWSHQVSTAASTYGPLSYHKANEVLYMVWRALKDAGVPKFQK